MIGVVICSDFADQSLLGLSLSRRSVLALQAAGASEILLIGPSAQLFEDERLRVPMRVAERWPMGDTLVVADGVAINPATLHAMTQGDGEQRMHEGLELLCARTQRSANSLSEIGLGAAVTPAGVALFARSKSEVDRAQNALLASLRKRQDGWVSRTINRRLSLAITRSLTQSTIRPNQLSAAIMVLGASSGIFAALGGPLGLALGGVLFQAQSVLDGCDGELSRLTFRGSRAGEWLDTVGDDLTNYSFFAGASLGLRALGAPAWVWVAGLVGVLVGVVASLIEYRYLVSIGSGDLLKYPLGFGEDPDRPADPSIVQKILGAFRPMFKRDFFALATMFAALVGPGALGGALVLFAAGATATLTAVLASEIRRARTTA
ncbi:MAG: CDP-alcohol phosphatidyltransferase family protein [Deltaproteobacteria bacterium]|nr:CDP-alcohol phosphatidyltransferase family protein [Deltaproteobacteria bacterium]